MRNGLAYFQWLGCSCVEVLVFENVSTKCSWVLWTGLEWISLCNTNDLLRRLFHCYTIVIIKRDWSDDEFDWSSNLCKLFSSSGRKDLLWMSHSSLSTTACLRNDKVATQGSCYWMYPLQNDVWWVLLYFKSCLFFLNQRWRSKDRVSWGEKTDPLSLLHVLF